MVHDYDSETQPAFERSWTGLAAGAGAGLEFPLGGVRGFAQAWMLNGFLEGGSTTVAGLSVGVRVPRDG